MIPNTSFSVNTIQDHLPSSGRQKKYYAFPLIGKQPPPFWCSPDILQYRVYYIIFSFIRQYSIIFKFGVS